MSRRHSATPLPACGTVAIGHVFLTALVWGVVAMPPVAQAQRPAAAAQPPAAAPAEATARPEAPSVVPVVSGTASGYGRILEHWTARKEALRDYRTRSADEEMQAILRLRLDAGVRNLPSISAALVREADAARERSEHSRAETLARASADASPDLALPWLALARARFGASALRLDDVFSALGQAVRASFVDPRNAFLLVGNTAFLVFVALYAALLVFALTMVVQRLRHFLHDFNHLLPNGVSSFQSSSLAVLLLFIPVALRLGAAASCLTWLAVLWTYGSVRERAIGIVMVVAFAASPLLVGGLATFATYPASRSADLYEVTRVGGAEEATARVEARLAAHPQDVDALLALGVKAKREGQFDRARALYDRARSAGAAAPTVLNNLGNLAFIHTQFDTARDYYEHALKRDGGYALAHYNLHLLEFQLGRLDEGTRHREKALALDRAMVERLDALKGESSNRMAFDDELSDARLWQAAWDREEDTSEVQAQLWQFVSTRLPPSGAPLFAFAMIVVAGLLHMLRQRTGFAVACTRCGRTACRICEPEIGADAICEQCFNVFVRKTGVEPRVRIQKEIRVLRYQRRRRNIVHGMSFVLMGLGHLIAGRTLRGFLFLVFFCAVLVKAWYWNGLLGDPTSIGSGVSLAGATLFAVTFVGAYALSLVDILVRED